MVRDTAIQGPMMRATAPLLIEEQLDESAVTMRLTGELDVATRGDLRACLRRWHQRGNDVHLDLSALEFIDAAGVGLLVRALACSRGSGWTLLIEPGVTPEVAAVFDLVGLSGSDP